jgi:two-component system sensor histidine kinase KdpD
VSEPQRPDPDALLAAQAAAPGGDRRGRLKIFLGMSPGVGKTYAMLEAAQARRRAGDDVVVGLVETHGRRETEQLLAGLEVLPRRTLSHRGVKVAEFDLDAALSRAPALLLVDELAHTNVPGSRHDRRWQDVEELLEAGLDVFTTLNVQHVESRAGTVGEITGVTVRETVPDSILDRAEIKLVDLSPADLRRRLDEGKVYLGSRAAVASANFFREANLTALREMTLRLAADHAGQDTREFHRASTTAGPWKSGHRLLVAVGPSPHSAELIRWTRRFADSLACPWLAVHVESAPATSDADQARVTAHLDLARRLGAEVVTTTDQAFVGGLLRVAREANVTHLIVGKPGGGWRSRIRGEWRLLRTVRESGGIDVHVVRVAGEREASPVPVSGGGRGRAAVAGRVLWREHGLTLATVAATAGLCGLLDPLLGPRALAFVFLLPVVALALCFGRAAVFVAATASALAWNFLFLPPRFTFVIQRADDLVLFAGYFVVAAFVGQLVHRLRSQEQAERQRERRTRALYELTRDLAAARTRDEVVWTLLAAVDRAFRTPAALSFAAPGGEGVRPHPDSTLELDDKERSVASWAARYSRPSGRFTGNLPGSAALHVPLATDRGVAGVLSLTPPGSHAPPPAQRELLEAFARHAALVLDRLELQRDVERGRLAAESDRLGRALLDCVSHELRTPLTVLHTAASALQQLDPRRDPVTARALAGEVTLATHRLGRLVDHLLDMSRIESGVLQPQPQWVDPVDLATAVRHRVGSELGERPWSVQLDPRLPLVWLDPRLTEQALANLVHNACLHTPAGTPVELTLRRDGGQVVWEVLDRGPGFAPEAVARVFDKFYRSARASAGGTGLGLAIARGFVVAQGGSVAAANRSPQGAVVTVRLPYREPPRRAPAPDPVHPMSRPHPQPLSRRTGEGGDASRSRVRVHGPAVHGPNA